MKRCLLLGSFLFLGTCVFCQNDTTVVRLDSLEMQKEIVSKPEASHQKIYKLKPTIDLPLTAIGTGWSLYAFSKIYSKDTSTTAQILALNKNNIARINRHGVKYYSETALNHSNLFFYGSMPLPIILLLDKDIRHDAVKTTFLYLEAMSVTGLLYTGSVYFHDKYRPYAYNPNVPLERRRRGGAKNSFFAGHVALVGTATFFTAQVFSDYHPDSKVRWLMYTIAGGATAATGYLRYRAGEHFLTDILIGSAVGPLSGMLVPHLHKVLQEKAPNLSITPYFGAQQGISLTWRLNNR